VLFGFSVNFLWFRICCDAVCLMSGGPISGLQHGTSGTALTETTPKTTLSAVATPVAASAKLTTLKTKTTYYYQVVVTTAAGAASSSVLSFTTN